MRRRNCAAWPLLALPLLIALAGCGSTGSTGASAYNRLGNSVWITPGKYQFHNCLQAQQIDVGMAARQKELEELMNRSEKGAGGAAVNFMVYRSEYQQVLGERQELGALLEEKRCNIESPRSSDRKVF